MSLKFELCAFISSKIEHLKYFFLVILAHPKIKAFVTHGGLGGINEAIYYAVPMIAFPVFAEQDYNSNFLEPKGIGIKMEIVGLKAEKLEKAISKIIGDER